VIPPPTPRFSRPAAGVPNAPAPEFPPTPKPRHATRHGAFAALLLLAAPLAADSSRLGIFAEEDPQTPETWRLVWSTVPGHRYEVQESADLQVWSVVPGFPAVADGPAQQMPLSLTGQARYFRVRELDEQPPVIVSQSPKPDAFAVPRLAGLTVELDDATGVDPASLRLTVEPLGTFTLADPQLTFTNRVLSLTPAGDQPLGAFGTKVTASLIAADVLGNRGTNTWSFDLEVEPKVVTNLFVFGSGRAQRSGQKVAHLPTAALAERAGPVPASPGDSWTLEEVAADRLVLAYTGEPPAFLVGTYLSNLTPRRPEEIFYRQITSVSDDPANRRLTLFTRDVPLTEMVSQGSVAITGDSSILNLSDTGDFTGTRRLVSLAGRNAGLATVAGSVSLPRIGLSLDGAEFKLRRHGFESRIGDVTLELGDKPDLLRIKAEQLHWWLTPRLDAALALDRHGLQRFEAIVSGNIATATILDVDVLLIGIVAEIKIFDLPELAEPKVWILLGTIGPVPVFASLGFDLQVTAEAEARADFNGRFGQTLDQDAAFGAAYTRGEEVRWVRDFRSAPVFEPFTWQVVGEASLELSLEPTLQFLVYGLAGLSAGVIPSGRCIFEAGTATPLTGRLEADVSLALGLGGPLLEKIKYTPEQSWTIWEEEWPLFPQETVITFRQQPQSQTVTAGDSAYFSCAVNTAETPRYQWVHEGVPLPGQTSRTLLIPNVSSRHAGAYWVEVTAGTAHAKSAPATLTVLPRAPRAVPGMVWIPPGTFTMGSPASEPDRHSDEGPQTVVTLSRGFFLGKYEVTQREYLDVMGTNPSYFTGDLDRPVEQVTWYEAVEYCNRLTARERAAGRLPAGYEYRLPTEAQWEYACRAGTTTATAFGDSLSSTQANFDGNYPYNGGARGPYLGRTTKVGSYSPNAWGLYDMHGNVWEWCADWYSVSYPGGRVTDPRGPTLGSLRVCRGSSWFAHGRYCRSAYRYGSLPSYWDRNQGFRVALVPVP
jgi:formylglycine-generating enzyme required for sulfatase activity